MSVAVAERLITPDDYLAAERAAENKSEYLAGRVVPMAGAAPRHNRLSHNVEMALCNRLDERGYEVFSKDMRVMAAGGRQYSYPDIVVADGHADFEGFYDDDEYEEDILLNPVLIVEILSRSTEELDRGEKFERYKQIESLNEYLLVSQTERQVEQRTRSGSIWRLTMHEGLEASIWLEALD